MGTERVKWTQGGCSGPRECEVGTGRVEWTQGGWGGHRAYMYEGICKRATVYTDVNENTHTHTHLTCHKGKF